MRMEKAAVMPLQKVSVPENMPTQTETSNVALDVPATPSPVSEQKAVISEKVVQSVAFTSQAPSGQWNDPVFQGGCEEAAILMAHSWIDPSIMLSKAYVEKYIRNISADAEQRFGKNTFDTSVEDTVLVYRDSFSSDALSVKKNVTLDYIRGAILAGNIVIAPFDGQKLGNPHYSPPGPERHMMVIIGYDTATKEFITNDPGTKYGKGYRYDENVLFSALRDYTTGFHQPIVGVVKNMIVVAGGK